MDIALKIDIFGSLEMQQFLILKMKYQMFPLICNFTFNIESIKNTQALIRIRRL